jgi:hypothetical protein
VQPIKRQSLSILLNKKITTGLTHLTKQPPHPTTVAALSNYMTSLLNEDTSKHIYLAPDAIAHDLRHLWAGKTLQGFAYAIDIPVEHVVRLFEDIETLRLMELPPESDLGFNIIRLGQFCVSASIYNIARSRCPNTTYNAGKHDNFY